MSPKGFIPQLCFFFLLLQYMSHVRDCVPTEFLLHEEGRGSLVWLIAAEAPLRFQWWNIFTLTFLTSSSSSWIPPYFLAVRDYTTVSRETGCQLTRFCSLLAVLLLLLVKGWWCYSVALFTPRQIIGVWICGFDRVCFGLMCVCVCLRVRLRYSRLESVARV